MATGAIQRNQLPDNLTQAWLWQAGDTIYVGDAMYDAGNGVARPVSALTSLGTESLDQAQVAPLFIGFSQQGITTAESNSGVYPFPITIRTEGVALITCPSQVLTRSMLVGVYSNGTTISANQVDGCSNQPGLAIGRVIGNGLASWALATTQAVIVFSATRAEAPLTFGAATLFGQQRVTTALLLTDANQTLTVASPVFLRQVPTATRTITLPLETRCAGFTFIYSNQSGGANTVTFVGSGATLQGLGAVPQNKVGTFYCDGVTWFGSVSA